MRTSVSLAPKIVVGGQNEPVVRMSQVSNDESTSEREQVAH